MRSLSAPCSIAAARLHLLSHVHPERCKIKGIIPSFGGAVDQALGVSKTPDQIIRSLLVSAGLLTAKFTQQSAGLPKAGYLLCFNVGLLPIRAGQGTGACW